MTCDQLRQTLDDYVDGILEAADEREARRHLASCPECRREEEGLRALLGQAAALSREREPERDLWPGVAARIGARRRPYMLSWPVALAAAAALAAVSSALTAVALRGRPAAAPVAATASAPPLVAQPAAAGGTLRESEAEYVRATAALLQTLQAQRPNLPPETVRVLEDNLRTIDQALAQIRGAMAQDPANTDLVHMLVSTHRKKLDTLERVLKLSSKA